MVPPTENWRRSAMALFAPIKSIDPSWLPDAFQRHTALLDVTVASQAARKLLRRYLPMSDVVIAENPGDLVSLPAWAQYDAISQRRLGLRLGAIACAKQLRCTIGKQELVVVSRAIDSDIHREALATLEPLVENNLSEDYQRSLVCNDLQAFFAGIGLSILLGTLPQDRSFLSFRLRYLFPQKAWGALRRDLICNESCLERLLRVESDEQ